MCFACGSWRAPQPGGPHQSVDIRVLDRELDVAVPAGPYLLGRIIRDRHGPLARQELLEAKVDDRREEPFLVAELAIESGSGDAGRFAHGTRREVCLRRLGNQFGRRSQYPCSRAHDNDDTTILVTMSTLRS